jgi:hypothetical protein
VVAAPEIVARLGGRRYGRGWCAPSPAHADKHPSLDIEDRDGQVLFICRAGCAQAEVLRALRKLELWPDETLQPASRGARGPTFHKLVEVSAYVPPPACCLNREIKCEHWLRCGQTELVQYRQAIDVTLNTTNTVAAHLNELTSRHLDAASCRGYAVI